MLLVSDQTEPSVEERAEHLKERIYVTSLAVVLALRSHVEEVTARTAAVTLLITVVGILLAVLTADFMSHLVVHARLPSPGEAAHMVRVCAGAFGAVVLPLVFVVLAGAGVWRIEAALTGLHDCSPGGARCGGLPGGPARADPRLAEGAGAGRRGGVGRRRGRPGAAGPRLTVLGTTVARRVEPAASPAPPKVRSAGRPSREDPSASRA